MNAQESTPAKPVDRWLTIGALVVGVITFIAPKTPLFVISLLVVCFSLLIHPIWNFWWVERSFARRLVALAVVAVLLAVVGRAAIPVTKVTRHADAPYVPPKGPLLKHEGYVPVASQLLCPGLPDEARAACLCPRPLKFTLNALASPPDNNYATEMVITTPREPMYRVRVFLRDTISDADLLGAAPHQGKGVSNSVWTAEFDRYSFGATSSAPQEVFRVKLLSATGIRVICANQEN
jgi:hypothetical protein